MPEDQPEMIYPTVGLHPSTTHLELNNTDLINDFIHNLRGEILTQEGDKEFYKKIGKPLMNDDGVSYVVSLIAGITSRDKILADLDEEYINEAMRTGVTAFILLLSQKWEEWNIDKSALDKIVWMVEHTLYANMTRAKFGNTLKQIAQISTDMNMIRSVPEGDKETIWKKLSPW